MSDDLDQMHAEYMKDPEYAAAYAEVREHARYHNQNPEQCPHRAIIAPVVRGGEEQPGVCVDCGASPVMERETDCPLCVARRA